MKNSTQVEDALAWIRPLRTKEQYLTLVEAANADAHEVVCPTHYIEKNGEMVGYLGLGIPTALVWLHTKKVKIRDSIAVAQFIENMLTQPILLPIDKSSPLAPFLPKVGFIKLCESDLYIKNGGPT